VYRNESKTIFFDALAFWNAQDGLGFSDPQAGYFFGIATSDGGRTWRELPAGSCPQADPGEAAFAASGTSLAAIEETHAWWGTGGQRAQQDRVARVFYSKDRGNTWAGSQTPIRASQSAGIFSLAFANIDHGVAVGGDYLAEKDASSNVAITDNGGLSWRVIDGEPPRGYRSCVTILNRDSNSIFVAVGPTGTDVSLDWGNHWTAVGDEGFHAVGFAADGTGGFAVGAQGRVGRWSGEPVIQRLAGAERK
jgi:photosystem II stability/assembly factor-like uncharacterized protein